MADSSSDSRSDFRSGFDAFFALAVLAVAGALVRAIYFTPLDATQGPAQKIYYVHIASATSALYLAFGLVFVTSALYLWLRDERLDLIAESAAELGVVFISGVLMTGPLWGKPIWGTWWTWDARITSTLFIWFVFLTYLVLRGAIDDRAMRARYSAVLGVLGSLLVPFIHLSVYMFRTLHPMPIVLKPALPSLSPEMLTTFLSMMGAFALFFVALLRVRYRMALTRERLAVLEAGGAV